MAELPPNQHIDPYWRPLDPVLMEAVKEFGTPLYVYAAGLFAENWRQLLHALPPQSILHYSVKANPGLGLIHEFHNLGAHFEVASGAELAAVCQVGVSPEKIIFVGPGKTDEELATATEKGLLAIVAESAGELERLHHVSRSQMSPVRVALRINPGTGSGTLAMGGGTQFGMAPEAATALIDKFLDKPNISLTGLHMYLGTGILDWHDILENTRRALQIADAIQQQTQVAFTFLDVGGGFGIPYDHRDSAFDSHSLREPLAQLVNPFIETYPQLGGIHFESGRFLVGPAGVFITRVLDTKRSGDRFFAITDGGINIFNSQDNYAGARPLPIRVLNRSESKLEPVILCGPLCTSTDRLAANVLLPQLSVGDFVIFYQSGAYGPTARPGLFLSHGYPREVLYKNGALSLIREKTSFEAIFAQQFYFS